MRRVVVTALAALAALVLPSAALAAGPSYVAQGGLGILGHGGKNRFVAVSTGGGTAIARIAVPSGAVRGWATLDGEWGIPQPTFSAAHLEGLTRDGKRLIIATVGSSVPTRFAVVDTQRLRVRDRFELNGRFAYDALSPDGKTLYVTQYVDDDNVSRYVVRAYDLEHQRLLPGRIADKTQRGWIMEGFAATRATSADGRWVYTLFMRPGGYPFIHALDAVNGTAHCIGLPWHAGDQGALATMGMTLANGESALALNWKSGRPWLTVNTGTWRITHVRPGGFPWGWTLGGVGAAVLTLLAAGLIVLIRRREAQQTREEALPAL
jgi:hypothetical protein